MTMRRFAFPRSILMSAALALLAAPALAGCGGLAGPDAYPAPAAQDGQDVPETEDAYPEPGAMDEDDADGSASSGQDAGDEAAGEDAPTHDESDLLDGVRQLIFEGKRSGEGYYSADGSAMIYQAEREDGNPFYQMYVLDLETGDTELVSTGLGKTTCGWFHPDGERILFAASHEDPEAEAKMQEELDLRESGEQRRYEWAYDDTFEIYSRPLDGGEPVNLTNTRGYDAEGSYSPDGSQIVFASNRTAYDGSMTEEEREIFERDNAYMAELYIMNADGSDVRRLTETPGYDGGPFFSPDGERIVWRRFNENGDVAEIWTMASDGSDKRQLTSLGAMSWAPYYHPSGDYIVFATSVHGFQNFEIYMVDAAGEREPVRVTFTEGPDVLPVFSPDGTELSWSTRRGEDGLPQIHVADWNDDRARELLALSPARGSVSYEADTADAEVAEAVAPDLAASAPELRAEDARLHVEALASDAMEGRLTGTPGEAAATRYVAETFEGLGLAPAGSEGYFQPFDFIDSVALGEPSMLVFQLDDGTEEGEERSPEVDVDWRPLAFSKNGSVGFGDLAFAGYGIVAPEDGEQPAYDSYGDLDVQGKWVLVLRYLPEDVDAERRQHLNRYASLRFKALEARDRGALGLLVASGPTSQVSEELVPLRYDGSVAGTSIAAASVSDELASELLARADRDLAEVQAALDGGEEILAFDVPGAATGSHFTLSFEESAGRNVLGRLQIGEAPSDQVVVVGAHVDHLGRGEGGDSLATSEERGQIHYGADDNASGVAGMLEIAQWLAEREAAGELPEESRDIVFAAWSGEELGLLGSNHYVKALQEETGQDDLQPAIAAYLNMDMIGRFDEKVVLQGAASSPFWAPEVEKRNVPIGLSLGLSDDTYLPTDATSFYLAGVPILAAFTGAHGDYHSPRDTADKIDYASLADTARLIGALAESVSTAEEAPAYVAVAAKESGTGRGGGGGRAYLGTIPDYAEGVERGVLLNGVSVDSPAEEAGLQAGDVLIELAGQELDDIYVFTRVLDGLKIGEEVSATVLRDGERIELTVTPGSRE